VSLKGSIAKSNFKGSQRIITLVGFGLELIGEAHNSLYNAGK
jgi:hypothetical protein